MLPRAPRCCPSGNQASFRQYLVARVLRARGSRRCQRAVRRPLRSGRGVALGVQLTLRALQALAGRGQLALELPACGSRARSWRASWARCALRRRSRARSSRASWQRPASACSARRASRRPSAPRQRPRSMRQRASWQRWPGCPYKNLAAMVAGAHSALSAAHRCSGQREPDSSVGPAGLGTALTHGQKRRSKPARCAAAHRALA